MTSKRVRARVQSATGRALDRITFQVDLADVLNEPSNSRKALRTVRMANGPPTSSAAVSVVRALIMCLERLPSASFERSATPRVERAADARDRNLVSQ